MKDMKLTDRERVVLGRFADGLSSNDVAESLDLPGEKVEEAVESVLNKIFSGSVMNLVEEEEKEPVAV